MKTRFIYECIINLIYRFY